MYQCVLFEDLAVGETFSVHPNDDATIYMRMATDNDALAVTGRKAGNVYQWPGWRVFRRPVTVQCHTAEQACFARILRMTNEELAA